MSSSVAQPETIRFKHLTVQDGLSQNSVESILQDHDGFLWFGTKDGLNKYNGYEFTVYRHDPQDAHSLNNNRIFTIEEDHQGDLWIGTKGGLNRWDRDRGRFAHYVHQPDNPASLSGNAVVTILSDSQHRLWVGSHGGLDLYQPETDSFTRYQFDATNPHSLSDNNIRVIFEDSNGTIWVGTTQGLNKLVNAEKGTFTRFSDKTKEFSGVAGQRITALAQNRAGYLWIGTGDSGLALMHPEKEYPEITHYHTSNSHLSSNRIQVIELDSQGTLWIGTAGGGLNRYDKESNDFFVYQHDPDDPASLSSNGVFSILEDQQGTMWFGNAAGGINYVHRNSKPFVNYQHETNRSNSLSHNNVRCLAQDRRGNLWIGTREGLDYLNRLSGTITHYRHDPDNPTSLSAPLVTSVLEDDDGTVWVGTYAGGLNKLSTQQATFVHYAHDQEQRQSLANDDVWDILQDSEGDLWIATSKGISLLQPEGSFLNYELGSLIRVMLEDSKGNLWLGGEHLYLWDKASGTAEAFETEGITIGILSILEDSRGNLWIGTLGGGIQLFDKRTDTFAAYTEKQGLPNNTVHGILEDEQGYLWLSTNKGICRFDVQSGIFRNYDIHDGLPGNEFNSGACLQGKDGKLYFGSLNGLAAFYPDSIRDNRYPPPVAFTDFKLFNRSVAMDSKNAPLDQPINEAKEIILKYWQDVITFEYVALNYIAPKKNQYAYKLEGFDRAWNEVGTQRTATYTNLDAGSYTFRVKGSNNDHTWNEQGASIWVTVLPPWWRTWWAYSLYGMLLLGVVYGIHQYGLTRERWKNALETERLRHEKDQEIHQVKLRLFTNVSHEFRTPLTLILGSLETLLASTGQPPHTKRQLKRMQRSARSLLRLVNQLLDFRKLEAGKLPLEIAQGNIMEFIRGIADDFVALAEKQEINYACHTQPADWQTGFDPDKLEKVLYNLLANAFKFTPRGGSIRVWAHLVKKDEDVMSDRAVEGISPVGLSHEPPDAHALVIRVSDTGVGISQEDLPHIFHRFYQAGRKNEATPGTGIGLALVKELVELHGGNVHVESEVKKGSLFTVYLPVNAEKYDDVESYENAGKPRGFGKEDSSVGLPFADTTKNAAEQPLVLVVEDNGDVRDFIREELTSTYRIVEAPDGEEGVEKALQTIPDLIISDVMMPRMDGIALCQQLKTDERTSHIPVVLLTARASEIHQIQGLETGADDYITKPFNVKILKAKIKNLLESRKRLQERFGRDGALRLKDIATTPADELFLEKAMQVIDDNLANPDFNAAKFGEAMHMGRTQFYRKIKALTGKSVLDFIRTLQLQRATQWLAKGDVPVAEVAYRVGFSDPLYFSKCFRKQYGVPPTQYAARQAERKPHP